LSRGDDPAAVSKEFLDAVKAGDLARVAELLRADPALIDARTAAGTHAAVLALYYGHPNVSDAILAHEPVLDLHSAAAVGDLPRVQELLEADPRAANSVGGDGNTALGLASYLGQLEVVKYLLTNGADVNHSTPKDRFTALTGAISAGHADVVEVLVAHGADANHRYEEGNTPLTEAAFGGKVRIVRTLLEHGADPNVRTNAGKSALAIAVEKGNREAADVLLKHGAKA
jgi:uncharacterized protein